MNKTFESITQGAVVLFIIYSLFVFIFVGLLGCADTKGRNYETEFNIDNNSGLIIVSPEIQGKSGSTGAIDGTNQLDLSELLQLDPKDAIQALVDAGINIDAAKDILDNLPVKPVTPDPTEPIEPVTPVEPEEPAPVEPTTPIEPEQPVEVTMKTEYSVFHTVADGRGVWNFSPSFNMPKKFILNAGNCVINKSISLGDDGRSNPMIGYQGWLVKPSEVPGRGYGVLGKAGECIDLQRISVSYPTS